VPETEPTSAEAQLQHLRRQLEVQRALDAALVRADSLNVLGAEAVRQLRALVPVERIAFLEYVEADGTGRIVAADEAPPGTPIPTGTAFPLASIVPGWLRGEVATQVIHGVPQDLAGDPTVEALARRGYRAACWTPLHAGGQLLGALAMLTHHPELFTAEAVRTAEDIAGQLATGIVAARQREVTRVAHDRLAVVHQIHAAILASESIEDLADQVVVRIRDATGSERVSFSTYDVDKDEALLVAAAVAGEDKAQLLCVPAQLSGTFSWEVIASKRPLVIRDAAAEHDRVPGAAQLLEQGLASGAWLPMVYADRLVGGVILVTTGPEVLTEARIAVACEITDLLAVAVAHARQREATGRASARLAVVHDIDKAILAAEGPGEIAARVVERLRHLAGAERATISEFDAARRVFRVIGLAKAGEGGAIRLGTEFPADDVAGPEVLDRHQLVVYRDLPALVGRLPASRYAAGQGMRVSVLVPLVAHGDLVGILTLSGRDQAAASEDNLAVAHEVADQLAIAFVHARQGERLARAVKRLELLRDLDRRVLEAQTLVGLAVGTAGSVRELLGADRVVLSRYEVETGTAYRLAVSDPAGVQPDETLVRTPLDQILTPEQVARPALLVFPDLAAAAATQAPGAASLMALGLAAAVYVPLVVHGTLHGGLIAAWFDAAALDAEAVDTARQVAEPLAVAVLNAASREATERAAARLAILNDVERAILAAESIGDISARVVGQLRRLAGAERVTICSYDGQRQVFSVVAMDKAGPGGELPVGTEIPAATLAGPDFLELHQVLYHDDLPTTVARLPGARHPVEQGMRVGVVVPVVAGSRLIGSLAVLGRDRTVVSADNVAVARETADQLAVAMTHAEARAELERRVAQQDLVHDIDRAILASVAPSDLAELVAVPFARLAHARRLAVCAVDLDAGEGHVLAFVKDGELAAPQVGRVFPLAAGLPMAGVLGAEEIVTEDLAAVADRSIGGAEQVAAGLKHAAWLPLLVGDRLLGGIGLVGDDLAMISDTTLSLSRGVASQIAVALQHAQDQAAVRERDSRLQAILEGSPNGILVVDPVGRIDYANVAANKLFGDGATLEGRSVAELLAADTVAGHLDEVQGWFDRPDPSRDHPIDTHARRVDGSLFPVHILLGRVVTPAGPRAIVTVVDLSDRTALEARLRQAERLEILGQFAGILAHDVRNHLTAVIWSAELLATDMAAVDPRQADVELIRKAAQDAVDMTRSVLEFARPAGDPTGQTDVATHIQGARTMLNRVLGDRVALGIAVEPGLPAAAISPTALTQVLVNLSSNARDAMPAGGTFDLAVSLREIRPGDPAADGGPLPVGRYIRIRATDSGGGMDEATRVLVFDPFYTTKSPGSGSSGTGLGLSSVFLLVSRAGGTITVDSTPGTGSAFTVDLPSAEPERSSTR
jgi:PAS domain S-box-containing protein